MTRKALSDQVATNVLLKSRRRCCICFGLNRDLGLKSGQIAHLDQKNSNSIEDNLAFLCLTHHDEYDSSTSQRKGMTQSEVKALRAELYDRLSEYLQMPVHFGELTLPPKDPYAGVWIRLGGSNDSAEITLTPLLDNLEGSARYAVTGFALWGTHREWGPNLGDFAFVGEFRDGRIEHSEPHFDGETYSIILSFDGRTLRVEEKNWIGRYGMNVHFEGEYERAR